MNDNTSFVVAVLRELAASAAMILAAWGALGGATNALTTKMRLRDAIRHILLGGIIAAGMGSLSMALVSRWLDLPPEAVAADGFTAAGLDGVASGWFALGTVEWASGASAGRRMEVADHGVSGEIVTITLLEAPVRPVAIGDTFVIQAGCDKRLEICAAKFANITNFRGFPHIPGQDAVIRYASRDGGHEGAVL
jgi:hypothetical protein